MALTKIGASLGGGADTISVTQSNHGLVKGRAVKVTGNGTYGYAKADTAANAEAIGIIIESDWDGSSGDNTQLLIALSGKITVDGAIPTGNLTARTVVFLSATSNTGELTSAEPTTAGHISKPMGVITYLNSEMIMIQQRGEVLSSGGAVLADEYVTNAKLSHMAANTVKVRDANSSGDPSDKAVADTQILIGDGTGFTAAALSGDVTMANDGAVTIANNAVENAMMADDSIGVAELNTTAGTASSSTFLRGDMQWQAAGGGAMTLISSTNVTSNTTNIDFTGLSGYETYFLQVSGAVPSSSGPYAVMQVGDSSGFDTAQNEYGWHNLQIRANTTTVENTAFAHTTNSSETTWVVLYRRGVGSDTNEGFSCSLWIHNKPNQFTRIHGTYCATSYLNETQGGLIAAERRAAITMDRVRFKFSSGSVESGRISLYGVAHA